MNRYFEIISNDGYEQLLAYVSSDLLPYLELPENASIYELSNLSIDIVIDKILNHEIYVKNENNTLSTVKCDEIIKNIRKQIEYSHNYQILQDISNELNLEFFNNTDNFIILPYEDFYLGKFEIDKNDIDLITNIHFINEPKLDSLMSILNKIGLKNNDIDIENTLNSLNIKYPTSLEFEGGTKYKEGLLKLVCMDYIINLSLELQQFTSYENCQEILLRAIERQELSFVSKCEYLKKN